MASKTKNSLPAPEASAEVASVLSAGTHVVGRLSGQEDVRVHGTLEGSVRLQATLFVEPEGVVLAEVFARDVVVSGTVVGNVTAENAVVLAATARVVGDVRAPRVSVAPGAAFRGAVSMEPMEEGDLTMEAAARTYSAAPRAAGAPAAARGAISERASEARRAQTPARAASGVRLPPRRAQAFTAAPTPTRAAWTPEPPRPPAPVRRALPEEDTIVVHHPAIRRAELPRVRPEALPESTEGEARGKKSARPRTLARGKHKVERVD
jgi:cytoskeletal protein CcmA (bactofilin family)